MLLMCGVSFLEWKLVESEVSVEEEDNLEQDPTDNVHFLVTLAINIIPNNSNVWPIYQKPN